MSRTHHDPEDDSLATAHAAEQEDLRGDYEYDAWVDQQLCKEHEDHPEHFRTVTP